MTLYIDGKSYNNSNDLNDLLIAVEKLPFQNHLYLKPLYTSCSEFYIILNDHDILRCDANYNKPEKVEL